MDKDIHRAKRLMLWLWATTALAGTAMAANEPAPTSASALSRCTPDAILQMLGRAPQTRVIATKIYLKGETIEGATAAQHYAVQRDLCSVKLSLGPGTPGPAQAPSTQDGIGIEVWLPSPADWNGRIHNVGGGGFMGLSSITTPGAFTPGASGIAPVSQIANSEGAVSAITDTGHVTRGNLPAPLNGSFLMRPDGAVNTLQWRDFSERSLHEMTRVTKQLTVGFYGHPARHAYFEGCSTGGRQAHKYAQNFPADYDGILAGAPAINWTRFINAELYPQVVMQQDLGAPISMAQLEHVSAAAVSACDTTLTGQHLGYITDPSQCRYDPSVDKAVLCAASGGTDTSALCLSTVQAQAVNKIWFGQTRDGSAPSPATDVGAGPSLASHQLWFGPSRGTLLGGLASSRDGQGLPFPIAAHQVALNLQDGAVATPSFINARGNGADRWKTMTYAQLAYAYERGMALQASFAHINTDNPDLSAFRQHGAKMMVFHGTADPLIPLAGTVNYYNQVVRDNGGAARTDQFYRLYPVPGMAHCEGIGSADGLAGVSPKADPPLPVKGQLYTALVNWVEHQTPPDNVVLANASATVRHPLCQFPKQLHYVNGPASSATAFDCR